MNGACGRAIAGGVLALALGGCGGDGAGDTECFDLHPCGVVRITDRPGSWCTSAPAPDPDHIETEDEARCLLEALRDGTPGRFEIVRDDPSGDAPGYCGQHRRIQVLPGRKAIDAARAFEDLASSTSGPRSAELRPAADYQKCLDDQAYDECITDAVVLTGGEPDCTCDYCDVSDL